MTLDKLEKRIERIELHLGLMEEPTKALQPKIIKTKGGFDWIDAGDFMVDVLTGIKWKKEAEPEKMSYDIAIAKFKDNDALRLPTKEEYEDANEHGAREVLDFSGVWWWSASSDSGSRDHAWQFNGYDGDVDGAYRTDANSVRCVGRLPAY